MGGSAPTRLPISIPPFKSCLVKLLTDEPPPPMVGRVELHPKGGVTVTSNGPSAFDDRLSLNIYEYRFMACLYLLINSWVIINHATKLFTFFIF